MDRGRAKHGLFSFGMTMPVPMLESSDGVGRDDIPSAVHDFKTVTSLRRRLAILLKLLEPENPQVARAGPIHVEIKAKIGLQHDLAIYETAHCV